MMNCNILHIYFDQSLLLEFFSIRNRNYAMFDNEITTSYIGVVGLAESKEVSVAKYS